MKSVVLVREIMSTPVRTVTSSASVMEAVRTMNEFGIGSVVVVKGDLPLGILTERDVLTKVVQRKLDPEFVSVKDLMSNPVVTIEDDVTLEEATRKMAANRVKILPVMREGRLTGIITSTDVVTNAPALIGLLKELVRARFVPHELRSKV